jgi:hypothetical protein
MSSLLDMDDPLYLTSGAVCIRCLSMTSTSEGMQALTSDSGYRHHDMRELRSSADLGCPLCRLCCFRIYHSPVSFNDRRFLRFYARGSDGRTLDGRPLFGISKLVFKIQDRKATLATNFELHAYTSRGVWRWPHTFTKTKQHYRKSIHHLSTRNRCRARCCMP